MTNGVGARTDRGFPFQTAAVIVAHPDDEILWAGGTILTNSYTEWRIFTLCRASDPDRSVRFRRVMEHLDAVGAMADLDDGPEQRPLPLDLVKQTVSGLAGTTPYDVVLTHGPHGEYTRHRRHEETSQAVGALWTEGTIRAGEVWMFAYDDEGRTRLPEAVAVADVKTALTPKVWQKKYEIMTSLYGFNPDSWEAHSTPRTEGFWRFTSPQAYTDWIWKENMEK